MIISACVTNVLVYQCQQNSQSNFPIFDINLRPPVELILIIILTTAVVCEDINNNNNVCIYNRQLFHFPMNMLYSYASGPQDYARFPFVVGLER